MDELIEPDVKKESRCVMCVPRKTMMRLKSWHYSKRILPAKRKIPSVSKNRYWTVGLKYYQVVFHCRWRPAYQVICSYHQVQVICSYYQVQVISPFHPVQFPLPVNCHVPAMSKVSIGLWMTICQQPIPHPIPYRVSRVLTKDLPPISPPSTP